MLLALLPVCVFAAVTSVIPTQHERAASENASAGTHFSALSQITRRNVARLGIGWVFDTGLQDTGFEDTPLVVGGRMYVLLPNEVVAALDPDSGRRVWSYDPHERRTRVSRGIAYWPGTPGIPARLAIATADGHLIELDARTGELVRGFADHGALDLRRVEAGGYPYAPFGFTSPPAVYRDLLILGPDTQEGPSTGPPGLVAAVDAVTGKIVWTFHTTPQPGQPGNASWGPGGWKHRAGPAAWGNITVDPKLGMVFVPTANPADSYYGADRPGSNLYANSVVALDARTGRLRWFYQFVHHDLWDTDTVSTSLVDAWKDGQRIPAVAALTKSALLFILDRRTGEPIFGVRERPVAHSDVPGEHSSPTEPYPVEPPPLARQSASVAEATTVTPASEADCRKQFTRYREQGPYAPFQMEPSLHFPSAVGGGNWGGTSYDPRIGYVYVNTSDLGSIGQMVKAGSAIVGRPAFKPRGAFAEMLKHLKPMPYHNAYVGARFVDESGFPCQQPPWGLLSAVDMHSGRIAWQVPLGNYPELARPAAPPTGTPNLGGSMVTASGLIFIAATMDGDFRAFDARTGRMLWEAGLEGYGEATPMSYLGRNGKQYVAIAVGGPGLLRGVHLSVSAARVRLIAFVLGGKPSAPTKAPVLSASSKSIERSEPGHGAADGRLPPGAGRRIVQQDCTLCHGVDSITRSHFSRAGWQATVRDMMNRGAPVAEGEYQTVVDYLAHNFGASGPK
ncbi:MAG TPA: PQQ-binding-like beta-propeller repeat protein [Steroidobacteraceae bacterium]|nr:PQQ-binding-like beta-propeller repeat protein [Steroidobacteraceae bacterium]